MMFDPQHAHPFSYIHQVIWLTEFKTFKNKAHVFNHTGVNKDLADMIRKWHVPGQLLAVGNEEHKRIIESKLVSIRNKLPFLLLPVNNFSNILDVAFCRK